MSSPRIRFVAALAAAGLLVTPLTALAASVQIGYIDSARIFQEYKDAQEAQQRFDRQVQGWKDEAAEKEKVVNQLRAEVRDQSPILSSVKRQDKEEQLQRAISEYERFIQDVWGPRGRAALENEKATQDVVTKIRTVVEKVASDKGLTLVLDSASGIIIYADKSFDLTTEVLQDLNENSTSSSTAPH